MVQIKTEIEKKVAANAVTKIIGQPTNSGIDLLEEELLAIAASITTPLGGGNNGHAGILMEDAEYWQLLVSRPCLQPQQIQACIRLDHSRRDLVRSAKLSMKRKSKCTKRTLASQKVSNRRSARQ